MKPSKRGRPRTKEDIRNLVIMLAKENIWGFSRIVGELRKLGIFSVTPNTVKNILKAEVNDISRHGKNTFLPARPKMSVIGQGTSPSNCPTRIAEFTPIFPIFGEFSLEL